MKTIYFIGADGSGKSSLIDKIQKSDQSKFVKFILHQALLNLKKIIMNIILIIKFNLQGVQLYR